MPKLVVNPGTPQAREFELKPGTNYLGRGFANDFKIEDPSVSGSHAQIVLNGGAVMVKDLGSTNGTFINRSPVTEAALQPGHMLRLGGVEMLFQCEAAASVAVSSVVPGLTAMPPAPRTNGVRVTAPSAPPPVPRLSSPAVAATLAPPIAAAVRTVEPPIAAPPSAPPLAPAIVPGMVEAPPGMMTCKYHPKTAGQWLCQNCRLLFCSLCVSTRRTEAGTGYFCRKCATECVPVRVNYVAPKEKGPKEYSDITILVRSLSFGFGAAILAGALWTGAAVLLGIVGSYFLPGAFCMLTGILCGYAVKFASQDRPGIIFCLISVGSTILGIAFGMVGMILTTGFIGFGIFTLVCLLSGLFSAWKIGGGDF